MQGLSFSLNIIFSKFNFSSWKGMLPEEGQRDKVIELKISNIKIIWKQGKTLRSFTGSVLNRQGTFYCGKHSTLGLEPLTERSLCKYQGSKSKQTVWVLGAFCVGIPVFPACFPSSGTSLSLGAPDHKAPPSLAPAATLGFPGHQGPFFLSFIAPPATTWPQLLLLALPGSGSCSFTAWKMFWSCVLTPLSPHVCGVTLISVL